MTDLGIIRQRSDDNAGAVALLEEALALLRPLGDRGREADVLGNLGWALLFTGQGNRALGLLGEALALTRAVGDRFAEQAALERLGRAEMRTRVRADIERHGLTNFGRIPS